MSSSRSYWGGSQVAGGHVFTLEATTFEELVAMYVSTPVALRYSRSEWAAMTKDDRDAAKDGPYITACSFTTPFRNDKNAGQLHLVIFDIDEAEIARPFVESPEALADHLWPLNFVAWTTANSTPKAPRLRIMIDVEPCDPSWHKRIVLYMAKLLGLPAKWAGRRESYTLSLPFYRPVKFEGDTAADSPVIQSRTNREAFQTRDLPPEVIEESDRIYGYQSLDGEEGECGLEYLPIPGLVIEDVREALFKLDPDESYEAWIGACMALRSQFRGEEEGEEAFRLFCEWSEQGDKFTDEETTFAKWKSFRAEFGSRAPITIRSLFKRAIDAGWSVAKVAEQIRQNVEDRIKECEDAGVLSQEGPKWIEAMDYKNDITEETMIHLLQTRLMQLGVPKIDKGTIRKAVNRERRASKAEKASDNRPSWLLPWCYISSLDRFYSTDTGMLLTTEAFNRTFGSEMMNTEEAQANGRPIVQPADFALNTEGMITKVDSMVYDPRFGGENHFFRMPGTDLLYVNQYRASSLPKPDEKNSAKAGRALLRLLRDLLSREEDILHMLDWAAHVVQFPGKRIRHVPCIQGQQGGGKSMISNYIGAALGTGNAKIVYPKDIAGTHNDWAYGAALVTIDEIFVQGKTRAEIMNALKPLVTNDSVAVHEKFRSVVTVANTVNYIANTNHHNAIFMEMGDRRWWILKSKLQTKPQVRRLSAKMVAGMLNFDYHGMVIEKFAGAIRHFLLNYEIRSSFNPNGDAPDTPWRRQMIEASKNALQREIEAVIEDQVPLVGEDIIYLPALERRLRESSASLRDNHPPSHYLYVLGYQPFADGFRFGVNGSGKGEIWVNSEHYIEAFGHPHEILMERYARIPDETI